MTVNPAWSNFTPQVKQARNLMQIFNRRLISRNTTHRQSLHLIQSESKCCGCVYKVKKTNIPKNAKNKNLLRTKRILNIKMSAKGGKLLHLSCQGDSSLPLPLSRLSATPLLVLEAFEQPNNQKSIIICYF